MYNKKVRKVIQGIVYYLLPAVLGVLFVLYGGKFSNNFGQLAVFTLTVVLFVKPLSILFPNKLFRILMTYRREMGIMSFWFFFFHAFLKIDRVGLKILNFDDPSKHLFWATLAGTGMVLMGVTANNLGIKLLKRNWKKLHRIAYPVYFFALYHMSIAQDDPTLAYALGGGYAILKFLQFAETGRL